MKSFKKKYEENQLIDLRKYIDHCINTYLVVRVSSIAVFL